MAQNRGNILGDNFVTDEDFGKSIIADRFSNRNEVLIPDSIREFNDSVEKGEVDILTKSELEGDFSGQVMYKENYEKLGFALDNLVKKGEDDYLTDEEFNALEKGLEDYKGLIRKALPVVKDGTNDVLTHVEVYVAPTAE
jgi:hypothetical protein